MNLSLTTQTARRQPIAAAPGKYMTSRLRWQVERSDGIHISEAFYPSKFLPALWQDVETGKGVVLTKGTIVSCITNVVNASGMVDVSSSGVIPVFSDATTTAHGTVTANIDQSYWGYPEFIVGLLVPANGGIDTEIPYSALDVTLGTYRDGGEVIAAAHLSAGAHYHVAANMPIGIIYNDAYQDTRGKYLNDEIMADILGVCCDYYIEVPYVDYYNVSNFVSGLVDHADERVANMSTSSCAGYLATWKKYPFFYFDGTSAISAYPGQLLKPDMYGKFIPQGTAVTTTATAQTVGKLIVTDCRFPKDMLDLVDTFPGSRMPGTETAGLPGMLYEFIRDAEYAIHGSYPTPNAILTHVQAGDYGLCRIQLNI